MSQFLEAMKVGDKIDVRGPIGKLSYLRNGIFIKFMENLFNFFN